MIYVIMIVLTILTIAAIIKDPPYEDDDMK